MWVLLSPLKSALIGVSAAAAIGNQALIPRATVASHASSYHQALIVLLRCQNRLGDSRIECGICPTLCVRSYCTGNRLHASCNRVGPLLVVVEVVVVVPWLPQHQLPMLDSRQLAPGHCAPRQDKWGMAEQATMPAMGQHLGGQDNTGNAECCQPCGLSVQA